MKPKTPPLTPKPFLQLTKQMPSTQVIRITSIRMRWASQLDAVLAPPPGKPASHVASEDGQLFAAPPASGATT